jgi:hypothetical protein
MFVSRREKRNDALRRNAARNAPGTLGRYNSLAMGALLGGTSTRTPVRKLILALALACLAIGLAAAGLVFRHLNQAAGVQDFPYAPGNAQLAVVAALLGGLIAARRPELIFGWLILAHAVLLGLDAFTGEYGPYASSTTSAGPAHSAAAWVTWLGAWLWVAAYAPLFLTFALFPTGRLPSRRWRPFVWLGASALGVVALSNALPAGPLNGTHVSNPGGVTWAASLGDNRVFLRVVLLQLTATAAQASPLLRFRRAHGLERQQLKVYVFGLVAAFTLSYGATLVDLERHEVLLFPVASSLAAISLWIALTVAILRYRLFDIDVVINRALVYGTLTALLAGTFAALSIVTQRITLAVTGQQSEVAVVLAALVVTALFQPLRSRIQTFVDRRFYRSRYDASRTLEHFAARVRDEVELDHLTRSLVSVVQNTMQPSHASLWLRQHSETPVGHQAEQAS